MPRNEKAMAENSTVIVDGKGERHDNGKVRLSVIPPEFLIALATLTNVAEEKYPNINGTPNWAHGMKYSKLLDPALRHLMKFQDGQVRDEETGAHHLIAAAWGLMALYYYECHPESYDGFDDRLWKTEKLSTII